MSIIKLEIENTPENALAASAFFALLSGDKSAEKIAERVKGVKTGAPAPKTEAPAPAPKTEAPAPEPKTEAPAPEPKTEAPAPEPKTEAPTTATPGGYPGTVDLSLGLDDDGLPWDSRIHSSGKTKLAKKPHTWKLQRGIDKALVERVKAELRAVVQTTTLPEPQSQADNAAAFGFGGQPESTPAPVEPLDNQRFIQICMDAMQNGHQYNGQTMTQQHVIAVLQEHGIQNPTQVVAQPDAATAALRQLGLTP